MTFDLPSGLKVNLGCGPIQPHGWVNIDGSNRAWLASKFPFVDRMCVKLRLFPPTEFSSETTYGNLFKGLPYPENSISCVYAGELWEHFEYDDAHLLTKECYRTLKPGGVLRVCVPDGPTFWKRYLEIYEEEMSRPRSMRSAKPLKDHVQMYFNEICTRRILLGSMGHTHKWQYDEVQLVDLFESSGFTCVERMPFHVSRIPDISSVERSDFLILEGVKA